MPPLRPDQGLRALAAPHHLSLACPTLTALTEAWSLSCSNYLNNSSVATVFQELSRTC